MHEDLDRWYVRQANEVTGPFSQAEIETRRGLGELNSTHEISADPMSWNSESSYSPNESLEGSEGTNRLAKRTGLPIVSFGVFAVVGCILLLWMFGGEPPAGGDGEDVPQPPPLPAAGGAPAPGPEATEAPTPPPVVAKPPRSRDIRSALSVSEIARAVGFVVCTHTYEAGDGTKTEIPAETGTCFAISDQGYLLTNRHVIEQAVKYGDSEERKAEEQKYGVKIRPEIFVFFKSSTKVIKQSATIVFQTSPQDDTDLAVLKIDVGDEPLPYYFRIPASAIADQIKSREVWSLGFPAAAQMPVSGEPEAQKSVKAGTKVEAFFSESDFEYVADHGIVNVVAQRNGQDRQNGRMDPARWAH